MTNWKEYKLGEIGEVITGKTPSKKNPEQWGDIMPFVTPTDFDAYNKNIVGSIRYLSAEGINAFQKKVLPQDSVIVTCIGSQMGKVALNKKECVTNQQINSIIPHKEFNSDFIYYVISSMQDYLRNLATGGSTMPIVNKSTFEEITIKAPDLPTQTAIAEILSSLDDKIELNNKINQELENLAQTLFKQWFIDFEFPNEKGEPYKSSGGALVDSELGEIPKGWEVKSLDEVAEYLNGLALQKFPAQEGEDYLPVIKIRELRQGITQASDKASTEVPDKYIIQNGDVLFAWSGSLMIDFWTNGVGALNQHLFKVTSENYPKWFYFYWTKYHLDEFIKIAESKATTMGHIQRKHLTEAKVTVPNSNHLKQFNDNFENIVEAIISNREENQELTNLRDTLLPKLISGELEVADIMAEKA